MTAHLKFVADSPDTIEGWGAPYGGPFNGRDLAREAFTKDTDFALDWFSERPLLYNHGTDKDAGITVVGRVKHWELKDGGLWVQAQLDASGEYFDAITELIGSQKLYFSSGAMSHLVEVDKKSGEIKRWPWVEQSLTPTPCNLMADLDFVKAHFKAIGIDIPDESPALKASPRVADDPLPAADSERSYEDLIGDLRDLLNPPGPYGPDVWTSVLATYPDHVLVCRYDFAEDGESTYYDIPYTAGEDGVPALGPPRQVEQVWVPLKALASVAPLAADAAHLTRHAGALVERTRDLHERRVKSGRALSAANRTLIADAVKATRAAAEGLQALLDATDQPAAEAKGLTAAQRVQLQLLGLAQAAV